jgi:hypothetical protein
LKSSTVESIDIAGAIELFEKSSVEELSCVPDFRSGNLFGQFGQHGFESFDSGIGLSRHKTAQELIGIVQLAFLLQAQVFAKGAFGNFRVSSRELNAFDKRFYDPANEIGD